MGQPKQFNAENYLSGGVPFGPFTSRNLTPEEDGLPAGMTFEQFKLVIRTGVDLDKAHPQFGPLLQVMPWPVYQSMTDRDLRAIYEYLSAIPTAQPGLVPARDSKARFQSYEESFLVERRASLPVESGGDARFSIVSGLGPSHLVFARSSQLNTSSYSNPRPWAPSLPCA